VVAVSFYKLQINYKNKIKQKTCSYNSIVTSVPLKYLTHMLCLQYFISQTI
jgi:hypothetical protein